MPKLTITVDPNLCIGAAACVGTAPQYFQLDEDNIASVSVPQPIEVTEEDQRLMMDAAEGCPTGAIQVTAAN
jgi:ferredoxin